MYANTMTESANEELDRYFEVALDLVRKAGDMVNEAIQSRDKKSKILNVWHKKLVKVY